jgi:sugar/nucleoside kinase (ribokinase family)
VKSYDLVSIGNYTKDTIVSKAGVRYVDGGGYSYAAHAAHLRGLEVAAVTRLAAEDRKSTQPLVDKGVDVYVIESPRSTLMRLEYPTDNVDERVLTVEAVADPFTSELLADYAAWSFVVNGSARGEASLAVMHSLKGRCENLCADLQGFIRVVGKDGRLRYEPWPEQASVLKLVDILKTDAVEAEFLTGETDIHAAARKLAAFGPREVVLTHRDGLLVLADGEYHAAGFHPEVLRGRSGRGDTCMGSYVAARHDLEPGDATVWAAAATSIKMEAEGPIMKSADVVRKLIREKYSGRGVGAS